MKSFKQMLGEDNVVSFKGKKNNPHTALIAHGFEQHQGEQGHRTYSRTHGDMEHSVVVNKAGDWRHHKVQSSNRMNITAYLNPIEGKAHELPSHLAREFK